MHKFAVLKRKGKPRQGGGEGAISVSVSFEGDEDYPSMNTGERGLARCEISFYKVNNSGSLEEKRREMVSLLDFHFIQ